MKKTAKIKEIYRDHDGWWLHYAPGWKSSTDPVGAWHGEREDTNREVLALAKDALPCDCVECKAILAGKSGKVAGTGLKVHEYAHDAFAHAGYLSGISPGHAGTIERIKIDAGGIRRTTMGAIVCGVYYSAGRLVPVQSSKEAHDNGVDVTG